MVISIAIFEVGSIICAAAPSSKALIVGRVISGIGGAGVTPGAFLLVIFLVPMQARPKYIGSLGSVFGITSILGYERSNAIRELVSQNRQFICILTLGLLANMRQYVNPQENGVVYALRTCPNYKPSFPGPILGGYLTSVTVRKCTGSTLAYPLTALVEMVFLDQFTCGGDFYGPSYFAYTKMPATGKKSFNLERQIFRARPFRLLTRRNLPCMLIARYSIWRQGIFLGKWRCHCVVCHRWQLRHRIRRVSDLAR